MSSTIQIADSTFQQEVLESSILTVVDLWADWCAPCKRLSPLLDEIAEKYAGTIKVVELDVDANPQTPATYGVMGLPTLLVFKAGQLVDTITGFQPKNRLLNKILPYAG